MPAIPIQYVNTAGAIGLVAFGYFSYQWIERKRHEDPLPRWFREYVREVKRKRGELEEEENVAAPVSTLSPAEGVVGLICLGSVVFCLAVHGWSLNCQYSGEANGTITCRLNCTYNDTVIYQGPCFTAITNLRLNVTLFKRGRDWQHRILRNGLEYYFGGRIVQRLYLLSNTSTVMPFTGSLTCGLNTSNENVTHGKIMLYGTSWGRHVLNVTSRWRWDPRRQWYHEKNNVSETLATNVSKWLDDHVGTDRFFLSDVCMRLFNRLKKFQKSARNVTNQSYIENVTDASLPEWPTWTEITQMLTGVNAFPRLALCAWSVFSVASVVLGAVVLLSLFCGIVGRSRRHIQNDLHEMCVKPQYDRMDTKRDLFYINESADLQD
ncbi:Ba66/Ba62 [Baboon cytomegalovirus]|nr:Ba66/Ba62 [Baboon cytomegalovirus]